MNLFEKLNRLDDSLVESKRVVKKKMLTEGVTKKSLKEDYNSEDAIELVAEMITGGDTGLAEEFCDALNDWGVPVYAEESSWFAGAREDYAKILAEHSISLPMSDSDIDNAVKIIGTEYYNWTQSKEIKRQVAELEQDSQIESAMDWYNDTRAADDAGWPNAELARDPEFLNSALNWYLDSYYDDLDHEDDEEEDYDDDIDEMLTEEELTDKEKLMKTFPDDFGHWSTRTVNKTPTQHKTMNDYARDPNTPTYDNKQVTTKPAMSARDKLLKTFPDLDIRLGESYLKEDSTKENIEEELKQFAKYYLKHCPSMLDVWVHRIDLKDAAENEFGELTEAELKVLHSEVFNNLYTLVLTPPNVEQQNRYSFFDNSFSVTEKFDNAVARVNESDAQRNLNYAISNISDMLHNEGRDSELENYKKRLTVMTVLQAEELLQKHSAKLTTPAKKKVSKSIRDKKDKQDAKLLPNVKSFIEENLPLLADVEFYNENGTRYPLSHQPKKSPEKYLNDWKQLVHLMKQKLSQSEAKQAAEVLLILDNIPEIIKKELSAFN